MKKYGVMHYFQAEDYKEKTKQTNLKKYGMEFYSQTQDFRDKIKKKIHKIQMQTYNTKKQNHTFNSSSTELKIYNLLKEKFPDTLT